jgi:hypothetical protein
LFKLSYIYTGTVDQNAKIIQGLAGAKVKLQNEEMLSLEYSRTSDSFGHAYFGALPGGRYKCRVTARNHQEYIGRVWIKPGVTSTEDIFLDYNLVTVEWSVTETTIEDKYDIVLTAVYETDVPAAVVVIEPASVALPQMRAGDVFNGEFTLTNYGLIRADNLNFSLPADDQYFKYEMLGGLPDSLEAKERISVAYRATCLQSLDNEDDGGPPVEAVTATANARKPPISTIVPTMRPPTALRPIAGPAATAATAAGVAAAPGVSAAAVAAAARYPSRRRNPNRLKV